MSEHPVSRKATLLSQGQLMIPLRDPQAPGQKGTPRIESNGLGRYFVLRTVMDENQRIIFEYAYDPERVLEFAATRIRRERFSEPKFDYTRTFPVTRRLAYAAFEDTRPKNQPPQPNEEEPIERQAQEHLEAAARQRDVPIRYDL